MTSPQHTSYPAHAAAAAMASPQHPFYPTLETAATVTRPQRTFYPTLEAAAEALKAQEHAAGFNLAVMRTNRTADGVVTGMRFRCVKHRAPGSRENQAPSSTHPSKRRKKTVAETTGCAYKAGVHHVPGLGWAVSDPDSPPHNHEPSDPTAFSNYRNANLLRHKPAILALWRSGVRPRQMIKALQANVEETGIPVEFQYKDLCNYLQARQRKELETEMERKQMEREPATAQSTASTPTSPTESPREGQEI